MSEFNKTPIKFNFFTRAWDPTSASFIPSALTASVGPDQKMRLNGIASSSVKDLHGDIIQESALTDMERAAGNNLTIFGNHSYEVPEDVYGSVETAFLRRNAEVDDTGDPIHLLQLGIVINEENERAVKTWRAIQKGTKLGLSIGAMIPEGGATIDKKSGTLVINHLDLLETSIVGIPANPRSWVEYAVKSYKDSTSVTRTVQASRLNHTVNSTGSPDYALSTIWVTTRDGDEITIGDPAEPTEETAAVEPTLIEAAKCPDCGDSKGAGGGCDNNFHKDVEPEIEKVKVRVTVDTGDKPEATPPPDTDSPSGDTATASAAPESEPAEDNGVILAVPESASDESTNPELTTGFGPQFQNFLDELTQRALEAERGKLDALAAKTVAESQRDAIVISAGEVIAQAQAIISKLADLPLGPRAAVVRQASNELESLEGIYSRDFLELLRSKPQ